MYQTSEQCAQQFKTMTGLPQVQKALELIEQDQDRCIAEQCELVPVSYTHRDVYKRQRVSSARKRRSASACRRSCSPV